MNEKVNGLIAKIQKNPFLAILIVVVIGTAIFTVSTLSNAIKDKIAVSATTEVAKAETTEPKAEVADKADNIIEINGLKKYTDTIKKVEAHKEPNQIVFYVEFAEKEDLLAAHYATNTYSFDVTPMLYFYIDNGLQVKVPGEIRLLSDGLTAVYYFSEIDDYVNAVFLTDGIVTDLSTLLNNQFNLYIEHRSNDGVGKTLVGNYAQTVEQFNQLHAPTPMDINIVSDGIKKVEVTACDDFIWVDIYYVDEAAYKADNADLEKNFVVFGFEKGGNKYKRDFIITEYEKLYMNRCVFDKYAVQELGVDMMVEGITVKELFDTYAISVWVTDYTTDKALFDINGGNDVHDELEEENFGEFENVDTSELEEIEMN